MIIPKGIGSVLFDRSTKQYAVRGEKWWTYGSYTLSDENMQDRVDDLFAYWDIVSEGIPTAEPTKYASTVYQNGQVFLRWTQNHNERYPWIGAKDGLKVSWQNLLDQGKVELYDLERD